LQSAAAAAAATRSTREFFHSFLVVVVVVDDAEGKGWEGKGKEQQLIKWHPTLLLSSSFLLVFRLINTARAHTHTHTPVGG